MIAVFTFNLADLKYQIRRQGVELIAPCQSDFIDSSKDSWPIRGDVTFLNSYPAELSLKLYNEPLDDLFMRRGIDDQVKEWRAQDYPGDQDAYILSYWPKSNEYGELLCITAALRADKFDRAQAFLHAHIGRRDLSGRLICTFHGFREEHYEDPTLPTEKEFMEGRHYFAMADHSLTFSASLP